MTESVTRAIRASKKTIHGRIAANTRWKPNEPELIADDQRDLRALTLEEHIRRVVDAAPPLTSEQRARLACLLAPGGPTDPSTPDGTAA